MSPSQSLKTVQANRVELFRELHVGIIQSEGPEVKTGVLESMGTKMPPHVHWSP